MTPEMMKELRELKKYFGRIAAALIPHMPKGTESDHYEAFTQFIERSVGVNERPDGYLTPMEFRDLFERIYEASGPACKIDDYKGITEHIETGMRVIGGYFAEPTKVPASVDRLTGVEKALAQQAEIKKQMAEAKKVREFEQKNNPDPSKG